MPETLKECPVCGSEEHHLFFGVADQEDRDFHLCHNCGCAFRVNRPTDEENIEWYRSGDYRKRTAISATVDDEMRHQQNRAEDIASMVEDRQISSHLDIGCSGGSLLREVAKDHPGVKSVGVDIDPEFMRYARGFFIMPSIYEVVGKFDLITMIHTLEHIAKPPEFMQEVAKHLAPGGVLIIEVPNRRAWMVAYSAPEHIIAYEKGSLTYLLGTVGLKIGATFYQGHIQGSPLDLNVIVIATNDPEKFMNTPENGVKKDKRKVMKVFIRPVKE